MLPLVNLSNSVDVGWCPTGATASEWPRPICVASFPLHSYRPSGNRGHNMPTTHALVNAGTGDPGDLGTATIC